MKSNLDVDTIEFKVSLTNGLSTSEPLGLTESGLGPGLAWTRPPFAAGTSRTARGSELQAVSGGHGRRAGRASNPEGPARPEHSEGTQPAGVGVGWDKGPRRVALGSLGTQTFPRAEWSKAARPPTLVLKGGAGRAIEASREAGPTAREQVNLVFPGWAARTAAPAETQPRPAPVRFQRGEMPN